MYGLGVTLDIASKANDLNSSIDLIDLDSLIVSTVSFIPNVLNLKNMNSFITTPVIFSSWLSLH